MTLYQHRIVVDAIRVPAVGKQPTDEEISWINHHLPDNVCGDDDGLTFQKDGTTVLAPAESWLVRNEKGEIEVWGDLDFTEKYNPLVRKVSEEFDKAKPTPPPIRLMTKGRAEPTGILYREKGTDFYMECVVEKRKLAQDKNLSDFAAYRKSRLNMLIELIEIVYPEIAKEASSSSSSSSSLPSST